MANSASPPALKTRPLDSWTTGELAMLAGLTALAAVVRFWRLGSPAALVFDEQTVFMQAGAYLRGWPFFLSLHPPLAKLLVALSINCFGPHAYARRVPGALLGTALVPANYLLARRMFLSRFAGLLGGVLTFCEGFLLVASRIAMVNIFAVAFAAFAYLGLFHFRQAASLVARRRLVIAIGIVLGCEIATKAGISAITAIVVTGYLLITLWNERIPGSRVFVHQAAGTLAMIGGLSAAIYVATFIPYYHYGWWAGIGDLIHYQRWVIAGNLALPRDAPYSSPPWSWPLMLRPFPYWSTSTDAGKEVVVWCGGNPAIWWEIPPALVISAWRAIKERGLSWSFAPVIYTAYMLMWLPVRRYLLIYDYMPMCAIGIIAVAGVLALCWREEAGSWEQALALLPALVVPLFILHFVAGAAVSIGVAAIWVLLHSRKKFNSGRFVCAVMLLQIGFLFAWFYPLWVSIPLSNAAYMRRMWFRGLGLANWR